MVINRKVNAEGFAQRLHHLALEKTARRFTRWLGSHRAMVMRCAMCRRCDQAAMAMEKARFDAAADTYLVARQAGFDGDLMAWVKFVETAVDTLNEEVARHQRGK